MKTIRKTYPQVYEYSKGGNTYFAVSARKKRLGHDIRRNFTSRKEALEFAQKFDDEVVANGKNAFQQIIQTTDRETQSLIDRLKVYGRTLKDAVDFYIQWLGKQAQEALIPNIGELVDKWESGKLNSKINPLAKKTQTELKSYARWIRYNLGTMKPNQVEKAMVVDKLEKINATNRTRRQYFHYIRMFFIWAKNEGYATRNPTDAINIKTPAFEALFYTPKETDTLMRIVQKDFPKMIGCYALKVFAGLRPSEALRVQWQDISFKTGEIYVRKGKMPSRHFELHPTAIKWLNGLPKDQPLIPKANTARLNKEIRKAFTKQTGREWVQDGLRHGFATYLNALRKDGGFSASQCLGDDLRTVKRHYMRTIAKDDMEAFWSILPETNV